MILRTFHLKFDIKVWSLFAILGGLCAYIASKSISSSKIHQNGAIAGFMLLAFGQTIPILGGLSLVGQCFNSAMIYGLCRRKEELVIGMAIHILLFTLCLWTTYKLIFLEGKNSIKLTQ